MKTEGENNCNTIIKKKSRKVKAEVTRAYITKEKIIFELDNDETITSVNASNIDTVLRFFHKQMKIHCKQN